MQTADEWLENNWCEVNGGGIITVSQVQEMARRIYSLPNGELRKELKLRLYKILSNIEDWPNIGPTGG